MRKSAPPRIDDAAAAWREEAGSIPDVISIKYTEPQIGPAGLAIDVRLKGQISPASSRPRSSCRNGSTSISGVVNIQDDLGPASRNCSVRLKPGASTLGVDSRMIADQLRTAFFGTTVSEIQVDGEAYEVDVRLALATGTRWPTLIISPFPWARIIWCRSPLWPISISPAAMPASTGSTASAPSPSRAMWTPVSPMAMRSWPIRRARFFPGLQKRYPDLAIGLEGENKEAQTAQQSMVRGFLVGLIGVYLLLSFLFRSYIEPVVVMVVIPFSFIGVIFGHMALGLDFTMPSMLGFIALSGVVVNDSILLVNFIKHYHGEVNSVTEAAPWHRAPVSGQSLLTSLTTIVGLLPMLAETSLQAQVLIPLVTSLAFGLLASTFLVLFLVPAIYSILDDMGVATLSK